MCVLRIQGSPRCLLMAKDPDHNIRVSCESCTKQTSHQTIRHLYSPFTSSSSSKTIQSATLRCIILNGVIFLGSMLFFERLVMPTLHFVFGVSNSQGYDEAAPFFFKAVYSAFRLFYNIFWVYPIYAASFILNSIWYQQIADRAYQMQQASNTSNPSRGTISPAAPPPSFLARLPDEIYRALFFANYLVLISVVYSIPVVGPGVSLLFFTWITAYYCFEYVGGCMGGRMTLYTWISRGWKLEQRLEYFEEHWAYFAGFGLPLALITFFLSTLVGAGVFAIFFPCYIIMATLALPYPRSGSSRQQFHRFIPYRLSIFYPVRKMNAMAIAVMRILGGGRIGGGVGAVRARG
ncbi:etoposide-induced protein 2.4-domain-containing protein [Jimgerdemannia flammicorona]|uniref:Etoposide-induced protein 2.4-domain-containing protein n=1 Tax=Jimgerdemannia flammicorona TaxID=994334 RepID=A0A433QYJ5_9FUNG|nr:etoposide-induced protein 2.4-domain-containing protein [Jimgerdemannia flammicorona]